MRFRHLIYIILAVLFFTLTGCSSNEHKLTVGFIYTGPVTDYGLSQEQDLAREALVDDMKGEVSTIVKENVDAQSFPSVVYDMVNNGVGLIFISDASYEAQIIEAAVAYPNVKFVSLNAQNSSGNLKSYSADILASDYLAGILAGGATETNLIGFVAPIDSVSNYQQIDAFALGVQKSNPEALIQVDFIGENPSQQAINAAVSKLSFNGCDVMFSSMPNNKVLMEAANNGIKVIGNSSSGLEGNENMIAQTTIDFERFYMEIVRSVLDGTFDTSPYIGTVADGFVGINGYLHKVNQSTQNLVAEAEQSFNNGNLEIFSGPIIDSFGSPVIAEGQVLDAQQLAGLNFFINNIQVID